MSSGLNKEWMKHPSINSNAYRLGVANFLEFVHNQSHTKCYPCPCKKCRNATGQFNCADVSDHLLMYGMDELYTLWYLHGETDISNHASKGKSQVDPILEDDQIANPVVDDVCNEGDTKSKYEHLSRLGKEPLFAKTAHYGESKHSMTDVLVQLNDWKTEFNLSDDCVERLLKVFKGMLPNGNTLSVAFDEMKCTLEEATQHCVTSGVCGNVGTTSSKPKKRTKTQANE